MKIINYTKDQLSDLVYDYYSGKDIPIARATLFSHCEKHRVPVEKIKVSVEFSKILRKKGIQIHEVLNFGLEHNINNISVTGTGLKELVELFEASK